MRSIASAACWAAEATSDVARTIALFFFGWRGVCGCLERGLAARQCTFWAIPRCDQCAIDVGGERVLFGGGVAANADAQTRRHMFFRARSELLFTV